MPLLSGKNWQVYVVQILDAGKNADVKSTFVKSESRRT